MVSNRSSSVCASLPAREVHHRLKRALVELQKAERNAVLWFAEVVRRKLYRELGHSSIYQYAELELGFKKTRTAQFLRLAQSLENLPRLRESLARGEIGWTKAREVATVATPKTESKWISKAREAPCRILEQEVRETRLRSRGAGGPGRAQVTLEMEETGTSSSATPAPSPVGVDPETPVAVSLRMTAEEYARYRSLLEALGKRETGAGAVGMILAGLERLVLRREPSGKETTNETASGGDPRDDSTIEAEADQEKESTRVNSPGSDHHRTPRFPRGNSRSPYQVIVHECPGCKTGTVVTDRGEKPLSPRELRTILCDAHKRGKGRRNKAAVPPRLRQAVLKRDRYRCRSAGCGRTGFLAVHHLAPREAGGGNSLENLITLCSGCHRALHAQA